MNSCFPIVKSDICRFSWTTLRPVFNRLNYSDPLCRFLRPETEHSGIGFAINSNLKGAFHSIKNSVNSGLVSEWNKHFPEFHSEILGVPREVGIKFRKIGITGKFCSIRPFLLGPRFSETGSRNSTRLILKLLNIILVLYQTND